MEFLKQVLDFFLHLDKHLVYLVQTYQMLIYPILFATIFCETGLVVTPFLPGDSLLFALGALCAKPEFKDILNVWFMYILLTSAALLGDNCNYWIGRTFGPAIFGKLVKKKYLDQTHEFYEAHGILTLIIAQFAPIIRTFAPFVAGVGKMTYPKFVTLNLIGVLSWTTLFIWLGYFFGGIEVIQKNLEFFILGIVAVSFIPVGLQVLKAWRGGKKKR